MPPRGKKISRGGFLRFPRAEFCAGRQGGAKRRVQRGGRLPATVRTLAKIVAAASKNGIKDK